MIIKPREITGNISRDADVVIIGYGEGGGTIAKEMDEEG